MTASRQRWDSRVIIATAISKLSSIGVRSCRVSRLDSDCCCGAGRLDRKCRLKHGLARDTSARATGQLQPKPKRLSFKGLIEDVVRGRWKS